MARILTVNVGSADRSIKANGRATGINKRPVDGRVAVRAPGTKADGLGSGVVGDAVCDRRHHGGDVQALYSFAREDLDAWEQRLGRDLPNGIFGENLTTSGIDLNDALVGEVWRIGPEVRVQVTDPRIPCSTFRSRMGVRGWVRMFTSEGRPGTYLRILTPGTIGAGDELVVEHRPPHDVTVAEAFRALTTDPALLVGLARAGGFLSSQLRRTIDRATRVLAVESGDIDIDIAD